MAGKTAILSVRILGDGKPAKKELDKTAKNVEKFQDTIGKAGLASGAALTAGLVGAVSADGANRKLAAGLGLTGPEAQKAGQIAGGLYKSGLGESMQDVSGAVDAVASSLADMSDPAAVERLTGKALTLAKTFGTDVTTSAATAGIMMKNGLAKDADEAFDLIAGGMQQVPAGMRDEIFPVMDEYSKHFNALGIDGTTAMGMIVSASENGAIGMDKMGDAVKEFTIRGTDMSKTTQDAYKSIGLSTEDMTNKLLAGGDAAKDATGQIIHGLQNIKDPGEQAAAALALFGTPLEDLGTNQIPEFLGMMDPMGDSFKDLSGTMEEMGNTINEGPSVAFEQLKRVATGSFVEIGAAALPVLEPLLGWLVQFAPILGPIALGFAAVAAITWIVGAAQSAYTAALVIGRGAIMAAQAAQWAWNAAMSANPIGLVIMLIAGLVAGVIWAYNNVEWFRNGMDAMGAVAVAVWETLVGWVETVIGWLDDMLAPIGGIEGALDAAGATATRIFDGMVGAISNVIGWVKDAISWFGSLFGAANDASGAASSANAAAGARSAAPMGDPAAPAMMTMAAMPAAGDGLAPTAGLRAMYTYSAPTSLGELATRAAAASSGNKTVIVKVEFKGLVTDKVGTAREIRKVLEDYDKLVGA